MVSESYKAGGSLHKISFVDLIYAKVLNFKLFLLSYCMIFDLAWPTEPLVLL